MSYDEARARILAKGSPAALETLGLPVLPDAAATWELSLQWWTTTPGPRSSGSPFPWSRFGGEDPITPVAESIAVLREAVRPDLLRVEVFPAADIASTWATVPPGRRYLTTLAGFVLRAVA